MANRRDEDKLIRDPEPPRAPRVSSAFNSALPATEPGVRSLADQRADLQRSIEEVEGTLRFMGTSHPRRAATEARLEQLRQMCARLEQELERG